MPKLVAEWFWIDRWNGSTGFLLPMEARGIYREMLTQAWRRGGWLPNDHEAIRRAIGATLPEWRRNWHRIKKFWQIDGGVLKNTTQVKIYEEARDRAERASKRGGARRTGSVRVPYGIASVSVSTKNKETPLPPFAKGGRVTRDQLNQAKTQRARVHGGCPHDPRCPTYAACVMLLAQALKVHA